MNRQYYSNDCALLDVRRLTVAEGRGKGVDLFRISNSAGLDFDVIIDRCMAIGSLRADGKLISYTSETGIVHPAYYEPEGFGWLRSFGGGFLATCGLLQVGEPCPGHGLHGRIDNTPAQQVCWQRWWEGDVLWAQVSGIMYEACHQGEYLSLQRTIRVRHDQKKLWITDRICNHGSIPQPFMLLYHVNFGAPFLRPGTRVSLPCGNSAGFDALAQENLHRCACVEDASQQRLDLLWLHTPVPAAEHTATVDNGQQSVTMTYSGDSLPILAQWELLAPRDYVLALEPTNTHLNGQAYEAQNGTLQQLQPDETVTTSLTFTFT